ncbi:MAG: radical SAM protein [Deltaproteobacteria bacterium]|nr:radical SAM protein [Deltaproteobacteria bacterium]
MNMKNLAQNRIKQRLESEIGARYNHGASFRMALVYPNRYFFGMSNLGFQTLYRIANDLPDTSCERMFLPEEDILFQMPDGSLSTYEFKHHAQQLNLIAFSVSYQNDYLNLIPLLRLMGLNEIASLRKDSDPLIIAGGPAVTINPEPIAEIVDVAVIGEGEEVLQEIIDVLRRVSSKKEQLEALSKIAGVYVPTIFDNNYDKLKEGKKATQGFGLVSGKANGQAYLHASIRRRVVNPSNPLLAQSEVLTHDTEFGDMFLLEVQRGCQWGCRFCAAGYMYRFPRYDAFENLKKRIQNALKHRDKIGLIAGDLLGLDGIHDILDYIDSLGGSFSPSSVRLNAFTPQIIAHLKKSGNRSIAIAPEAGSERLRRALNKTFTQEEIIESAVKLAEGGIETIKLYIMIGLPTENEDDIEELCELTLATRQALTQYAKRSAKMPTLALSISPFVPKPSTPLQYEAFAGIPYLKKTTQQIRKKILQAGHIRMSGESALDAYIETLLSRGPRQSLEFLQKATIASGKSWAIANPGQLKKVFQSLELNAATFTTQSFDPNSSTPWDFIDHGIKANFFKREKNKFSEGKISHFCMPEVCRVCGVC